MLVASGHVLEFRFLWRAEALDLLGPGVVGTALPDREARCPLGCLPCLPLLSTISKTE